MSKTTVDLMGRQRGYLAKLQRDPRTKVMFDGWVAQATAEADLQYPAPYDDRERAHFAARRAVELAMSFVLDNDGELAAVEAERDQLRERVLEWANTAPRPLIIPNE